MSEGVITKWTQYAARFKAVAVKQTIEKGHPAPEVSIRLGVPVGLLYTWARKHKGSDNKPIEDGKALQAEMTKLRAELRFSTEESDIPKRPPRTFAPNLAALAA